MHRRFFVLAIAAGCALAASNAVAAPERVRGTIASVSGDTLTVDTAVGQTVPVTLTDRTRYLKWHLRASITSIPVPISARRQNPWGSADSTRSGDLPAVPEGYGRRPLRVGPHSGHDALASGPRLAR